MIGLTSLFLLITLIIQINQTTASCPGTGYEAEYDLSETPKTLEVASTIFTPNGKYYTAPCASVDVTLCPYTTGIQTCFVTFTWENVGDSLGAAEKTEWSALDGDWSKGAVALNSDVSYDYDQCDTSKGASSVKTTYFCEKGDDSMVVLVEPSVDKNGACVFEFKVDSSIVCGHTGTSGGSSGGSSGGLSGGWIFVILLIVATSVYLIGGISWNHFRQQKTGLELLPNRTFWGDLPSLVKDGCIYFWCKVRGLLGRKGESSYASEGTTAGFQSI